MKTGTAWAILPALLIAACASGGNPMAGGPTAPGEVPPAQSRTVRIMLRNEAANLAAKVAEASSPGRTRRSFNAELALIDGAGTPGPYLAEALPQLNTPSWRVSTDGRMETTYRLRLGLIWHDRVPLTAEDFVFAWHAYTAPGLAMFTTTPQDLIDEIVAPDARTVVMRWRATYPEAGALAYDQLPPLPRHILEPALASLEQAGGRDAFTNHPFWTTQYVGAGPYRLVRWDAGYELEGTAFEEHALGRPRIDRGILRIMNDENTALSALLAGDFDYAECFVLRFEHTLVLLREWIPQGKGMSLTCPSAINTSAVQFRTELQKHPPLLDLRVRRAMAHAIDRRAIHDGLYGGEGTITDTFIPPEAPYFDAVGRAITHYPYDPRQTEQLMLEAGLIRDAEGLFASRTGERFRPDSWITAGSENERSAAIVAETWRRAGIDSQTYVVPVAATRDPEVRAAFPGLATVGIGASEDSIKNFTSAEIGTAANRWRGGNRGGWASPEVDRLVEAFNSTLDRGERDRQAISIARVISEQLPILAYHPNFRAKAFVSPLRGPDAGSTGGLSQWNIHEWYWAQ